MLAEKFEAEGIRVSIDQSGDTVGNKIRRTASEKLPYALVIGDKEAPKEGKWDDGTQLSVRVRGEKELLQITLADFISRVQAQIATRQN